ncbi:unnamed protein product [Victoria cruziana]
MRTPIAARLSFSNDIYGQPFCVVGGSFLFLRLRYLKHGCRRRGVPAMNFCYGVGLPKLQKLHCRLGKGGRLV